MTMLESDTEPELGKLLAAGQAPQTILIAQAMLDKYGPDGCTTDSYGNTWQFRDGTYVSVAGAVYRIDFDDVVYQYPLDAESKSYRATWPD